MRYGTAKLRSADQSEVQTHLVFVLGTEIFTYEHAVAQLGGWERTLRMLDFPENANSSQPEWFRGLHDLLRAGQAAWDQAAEIARLFQQESSSGRVQKDPIRLVACTAPIFRPAKNVFCVGRNYADHAKERGADVPEFPMYFTKPPTTIVGPNQVISYPRVTDAFDFEGELAVVIGRRGRDIRSDEANEYIFGFTILNDLTARDLQKRHVQFFKGKSLDETCPLGPFVVTPDELENAWPLTIETRVNDEVRQRATTAEMIFDIPTLIESLSEGMTLEPGDIIATGTPAGVGAADGRYLKPGDRIDIAISGLGTLTTTIV